MKYKKYGHCYTLRQLHAHIHTFQCVRKKKKNSKLRIRFTVLTGQIQAATALLPAIVLQSFTFFLSFTHTPFGTLVVVIIVIH